MSDPVRTCVGCRRAFALSEGRLVRVALDGEGRPAIGRSLPGRGCWICGGSTACVTQAVKRRAFARALRTDIPRPALDDLVEALYDFPPHRTGARD